MASHMMEDNAEWFQVVQLELDFDKKRVIIVYGITWVEHGGDY